MDSRINKLNKTKTPRVLANIRKRLSPAQIIVLSFLLIIIFGGIMLSLSISHSDEVDITIIDAFFTSVSAVCVTGLVTHTTAAAWSIFGKIVILLLIQIGGLSIITIFTFFMMNIGRKISLKSRLTIQATFNNSTPGGMVRMVSMVIKGTFICELVGAAFLFICFLRRGVIWYKAIFYGIFHSVSAFCNAGFDIIGDESLMPFAGDFSFNIIIMALIIIGGIGFMVWREIADRVRFTLSKHTKQKVRFSLHAKLVLITTGILLLLGTLIFLAVEYNNPQTLGNMPLPQKILASAFQSVTLRTAGFSTIAQGGLREASKLLSCIFMIIGGSPGGTAGGIKTVTIAIILCSVWSIIKNRKKIIVFERTITVSTLQKALTIVVLMLTLWFAGVATLSIVEVESAFPHSISDILYEVSSALSTAGISTGVTPHLSNVSKFVLMLCMFAGRLGPITLIISLPHNVQAPDDVIGYPEEDVMIG